MTEIYTHDTKLKRWLLEYAEKYPQLCLLTEDDEQSGLRFEIAKERISIRLTAPYSEERNAGAEFMMLPVTHPNISHREILSE